MTDWISSCSGIKSIAERLHERGAPGNVPQPRGKLGLFRVRIYALESKLLEPLACLGGYLGE